MKKLLDDSEIEIFYFRVNSWHAKQIEQHKAALPVEEFKIARKALNEVLKRARTCYYNKDSAIEAVYNETVWFVLPWKVLLWYSFNKADKSKCQT